MPRTLGAINKLATKNVVGATSKPFDSIPGPKPLPLIGNIWRYLPLIGDYKPDTLFENALYNRSRYGSIVREKITNKLTILHLFDPNDVESFFRQDAKAPQRRSQRALLKYRLSRADRYNDGGLFPENGARWLRVRSLFQHRLLSKSQVLSKAPKLDEVAVGTLATLNRKLPAKIELNYFLKRWGLLNALALFLDYDSRMSLEDETNSHNDIEHLMKNLDDELVGIDGTELKSERWNKSPSKCPYYQKLAIAESNLYEFVSRRVSNLIETNSFDKHSSYIFDWLYVDKIDKKDVITFVLDAILASIHTTAYTTLFLLKNITTQNSNDQVIQQVVKREIREHLNTDNSPINNIDNQMDKLPMLKNCLKETLRLNPISIGTGRLSQGDSLTIRQYKIPAETMIIVHNQAICRDPEIFEQPNAFKPGRWLRYSGLPRAQRPSPFSWLPYGLGSRSCIGQRLANLQMQIFVARLLQRYDIEFMDKQIRTKTTLVHNVSGPVYVEFRNAI